MCTGFTRDTHQYFMKASPVRPRDFIEFFAEIDLLGRCLLVRAATAAPLIRAMPPKQCYPLKVEIYRPREGALADWRAPERSRYSGGHGA